MIFDLKARRDQNVNVVSDLDAMVASPVPFRVHKKVHYIKPISVIEFYKFTNALAGLQNSKNLESITADDLVELYFELFHSICDTITHEDVARLSSSQLAALLKLAVDSVTGSAQTDDYLKKKVNLAKPS